MSRNRNRRFRWSRRMLAGTPRSEGRGGALLEVLEQRLALATYSWDGGPSGAGTDWADPANWFGDVLPGPTDDALINVGAAPNIQINGSVTVRSVSSAEAMTINGTLTVSDASVFSAPVTLQGTLAGTGNCTFTSTLNWTGGVMAGPPTTGGAVGKTIIDPLGSLNITGTTHDLNRIIENGGIATWTAGPLRMSGGTFNNNNSFTANASGPLQSFGSGGTNAFNNIGTFTKLGAGETAFSTLAAGVAFNSLGTVSLQAGTLTLAGGGTMSTPLTVSPGAAFTLGDTYTFAGNGSINGSGTVTFTGGTHSLPAGRFNPTGIVNFSGGTVTIATPFTPSGLGPISGSVTFSAAVNYSGALTISGTASFAVAQSFSSLALSGTLTGAGDITISGLLDWTSGTMSGSGKTNIPAGGTLSISSGAAHVLSRIANCFTTATWTGGDFAFAGGTFNNNGTFTANSASTLLSYGNSGTNSFVSNGTFTKLGVGEARFTTNVTGVAFNNIGTVSVTVGQLTLGGGGTASAAFNVAAAGTLAFAGNYTFGASGSIAGPGVVAFTGGTQTVPAGLFNPTGIVNFTGGTVTINNSFTPTSLGTIGATASFTTTLLYSAPITITGSASFASPQTFAGMTLSGTLTGGADITVTGAMTWNSGAMSGAGRTILPSGSTLTIGTGATHTLSRQILSSGGVTWTGGAIAMSSGTITNNGSFVASSPTTLQCYGASGVNAFNSAGTFTKQGVGDAIFFGAPAAMPLNNSGFLTVNGGTLSLGGGSTSTALNAESGGTLTFTGSFAYNAGGGVTGAGTLNFNGGTHTFGGGQFSPNGPLNFNGGTVTVNNGFSSSALGTIAGTLILNTSVSLPAVTLAGTIGGTGDLTLSNSLTWIGGTLSGTGRVIIPGAASITISTGGHTLSRRVDVSGAASWIGGDAVFSGGSLNILPGASLVVNSNAAIQVTGAGSGNVLSNAGTMTKLGIGDFQFVPGASAVQFNDSGSATVQEGTLTIGGGGTHSGSLQVPLTGSLVLSAGYTYAGGSIGGSGVFTFTSGTHTMSATSFVPVGVVYFSGGTVTVGNSFSPSALGTIGGSVTFAALLSYQGALTITGSASFAMAQTFVGMTLSGTLGGAGDITIYGTPNWSGGTMSGTGRTIIPAGSVLSINGAAHTLSRMLDVSGQATWTDGDIAFAAGSVFVRPGAALNASPTISVSATGTSGINAITLQGSMTKSGAGAVTFAAGANGVALANSGSIVIQDGLLNLSGGGSSGGTIQVQGPGSLTLGATMTYSGGSISGAGTVTFSGGTHGITAAQFLISGPVNFSAGTVTIGNSFTPSALGPIGATVVFNSLLNYSGSLSILGSASFAVNQSFSDLALSGIMTGAGSVSILANLTWTGGAMSGTGVTTLPAGAELTISGSPHTLARSLIANGTATWTGGDLTFTGGTLTVAAGASLTANLSATASIAGPSGVNAFYLHGQLIKQGAGTLQFTGGAPGVVFTQSGAITISAGTLTLGGGTIGGPVSVGAGSTLGLAGSVTYAAGGAISGPGTVAFSAGTHTLSPGQLVTTGTVNFSGGTITVAGVFAPAVLGPIGANVTFQSSLKYAGALTVTGSATFNASQTFANLTLSGTLSGTGNMTITSALNWNGGIMSGSGTTIVPLGATLSVSSGPRTLSRTLTIAGAFSWTGGDMAFADGTLSILPTGALTANTGPGITLSGISGTNALTNKGTITKVGAGAFTLASTGVGVVFSNAGTLAVQVGSVNVGPWVSNFAGNTLTGGTWTIDNTGFLNFPAGANIYTNAATIRMSGINSSFGALVPLTTNQGSLTVADGRLSTFSPLGNLFTNTGSFIKAGTGSTTWAANITINNVGSFSVSGGTLSVLGPISQVSGSTLTGGSWNVSGGGSLVLAGASIVTSNAVISISGAASTFDAVNNVHSNTGSFTVSGGRLFTTTSFTNAGKLTVGAGSTMTVTGVFNNSFYTMLRGGVLVASGGGTSTGTFWFFDAAVLSLNGAHSLTSTATLYGNGGLTVAGGTAAFGAPVALSGMLSIAGGTASFDADAAFGSASNAGTLLLGSRTLTLAGVYTQGAAATLSVRMDSNTQFGRIVAGGAVTLAGTLNVTWGASYVPAIGMTFNFISGSSRQGSFGTTNLAALSGRLLQLNYTATGVSLLVS